MKDVCREKGQYPDSLELKTKNSKVTKPTVKN